MGISFSSTRRNQPPHHHHHHHNPYYHHPPQPPPQPQPLPYHYPTTSDQPPPQQHAHAHFYQYQYQQHPPPPPPQNYYYQQQQQQPNFQYYNQNQQQPNGYYYNSNQYSYWPPHQHPHGGGVPPHVVPPVAAPMTPPPYVEHQNAKVIKNDVNVHKDTIKLEVDEGNPDHFLVSFVFDAHFDGSITIYYFAKEDEENGKFTPESPKAHHPVRVPFTKGPGQKFLQPSGTGVDLGFYELEALGKPSEDDVYPLVIYAEVCPSSQEASEEGEALSQTTPRAQVTQAVIEKGREGFYKVKVMRQQLWIDGQHYELRELYGIGSSSTQGFNDDEPGKECVICMTEPKDTAVMPCRHLCMCSDCAKELRLQTNKCPICRQPITELMEIKISSGDQ